MVAAAGSPIDARLRKACIVDRSPSDKTNTAGANLACQTEIDALLADIATLWPGVLEADSRRFRQRRKRLRQEIKRRGVSQTGARKLERLRDAMRQSAAIKQRRAEAPLRFSFSDELPVSEYRTELEAALQTHQVVIVSGATGSGKSTQLPKMCLALGRGVERRIGHTQPRRISARAIAARIAFETGTALGDWIGYRVRFDDRRKAETRLVLMTDGILLNEIERDPLLEQYDTLIVDEVHERSINIDVILGHLKLILPRRPDLKVIVTSATLDVAHLSQHFEGAAVLEIPGRQYPVETRYRALDEDEDLNQAILSAVTELDELRPGNILVFLPGEREIHEAAKVIRHAEFSNTEVLLLFSRLPQYQQDRIFNPNNKRRIVLATNVAETALTVPQIDYVIDSGLARVSRYSLRRKLQQLTPEPINRASADQRRGRCGRERAGVCVRLYSQEDFERRRKTIEPELLRTSLADTILKLKAVGIESIETFPFPEPPAARLIKDGYSVLQEIGALDSARALTPLGRRLSQLAVDPRLARVVIAADELGCLDQALVIVAALTVSDPRERPRDARDAADRAHRRFVDSRSDFMWFVNAWSFARELAAMPRNRRTRSCRRWFLSPVRLVEWVRIYEEMRDQIGEIGLTLNQHAGSYKQIHKALLSGFPTYVGEWSDDKLRGCRDTVFLPHPSSALYRKSIKWVIAADVVDSGRPYARLMARIEPRWITETLSPLIKRSYDTAFWDERRGCARVTEVQRLFGLVINASRQIELRRVDQQAARELLIREGLVAGKLGDSPQFLIHNQQLVAQVRQLEERTRRRDIAAGEQQLCAFYAARIPSAINSRKQLLRWLRDSSGAGASLLMGEADASADGYDDVPAYLFPDHLEIAGNRCRLTYCFDPGHDADGVTVALPLVLLPQVTSADFDRLVPGMLAEKVEALMRALPKPLRRRISPVSDFSKATVEALDGTEGELVVEMSDVLERISGVRIEASEFSASPLPPHLLMGIEIIDGQGNCVARGRDVSELKQKLGPRAERERESYDWGVSGRSGGGWTFGEIPRRIERDWQGATIVGYCGLHLVDEEVTLQVFESEAHAHAGHADAVLWLLRREAQSEIRYLQRRSVHERLTLAAATMGHRREPVLAFCELELARQQVHADEIFEALDFAEFAASFRKNLVARVEEYLQRFESILERAIALKEQLEQTSVTISERVRQDVLSHLSMLAGPPALFAIARDRARDSERYFDALARRIERIHANPGKDLKKLESIEAAWLSYLELWPRLEHDTRISLGRGFDEFRISLFSPELGAREKITAETLRDAVEAFEHD